MRDYLLDIVQHTHSLGFIDTVKITGTDQETKIDAMAEDRSVIVQGKFHKTIAEFEGTFGMPNLSKLNTILNIPEYRENAKIDVVKQDRNGETVPVGMHFENAAEDFKNDYRFMTSEIINEKLKSVKFRGVNWHVEFEPTQASIQRMKFQSQANSEETVFVAKTEDNNLKFFFGDHSTHAGNFVFEPDVSGDLTRGWSWPVAQVLSILSLPGDITCKFSDDGAAQITVDSGIAVYDYILPAQSK